MIAVAVDHLKMLLHVRRHKLDDVEVRVLGGDNHRRTDTFATGPRLMKELFGSRSSGTPRPALASWIGFMALIACVPHLPSLCSPTSLNNS